MYCTKCGIKNEDNAVFCRGCGAKIAEDDNVIRPQYVEDRVPHVDAVQVTGNHQQEGSTMILVLGIIGIATSWMGLPGLIIGLIALIKGNRLFRSEGRIFGKAKVGRILGKAGFIIGIAMTIVWIIYIAAIASLLFTIRYYN